MLRALTLLSCALAGLALAGCSQQNGPFMTGAAPTAAAPTPPARPPAPLPAAAQRAATLIGLPVRSKSGKTLGSVRDIIFAANGRATHLILAHHRRDGHPGLLTPIPWRLAIKHIHGHALIIDAKRFAAAPGFAPNQWPHLDQSGWSAAADTYWAQSSPHAFKPIDPTSRRRAIMKL